MNDDGWFIVAYFLDSNRCEETRQAVLAIQMCELRKNRAGPLMNRILLRSSVAYELRYTIYYLLNLQ